MLDLTAHLDELGRKLTTDGIEAGEGDLARVTTLADRLGVAPIAAGVLGDPSQPPVARMRAFALVSLALRRALGPTRTRAA